MNSLWREEDDHQQQVDMEEEYEHEFVHLQTEGHFYSTLSDFEDLVRTRGADEVLGNLKTEIFDMICKSIGSELQEGFENACTGGCQGS